MTKVVVTGGTGFIGSRVVERLVRDAFRVTVLKRSTSNLARLMGLLGKIKVYDVDKNSLEEIFETERAELIVHLATNYGRKGESVGEIIESNITFPSLVIDAASRYGLKGFVNTDTSTVVENSLYAATKKAYLHILNNYRARLGFNVVNLRLEYVYGPGDDETKFIPYLVRNALEGKVFEATGGMQKRDFVFVDDVVEAISRAVNYAGREPAGLFKTLEIGSGMAMSLRDFAALVEHLSGKKVKVKWGALPYSKNEIFESVANIESAKEALGWEPRCSTEDGVRRTIEWYTRRL